MAGWVRSVTWSTSPVDQKPNWSWLRVTTVGIQAEAGAANPASATAVMTPVGRSIRARTSPSRRTPAVHHQNPDVTASDTNEHEAQHAGRPAHVVRRGEGLPGRRERVAPHAEPGRDGGEDRGPDALGHERGGDDHQREERDERLLGQRDAAIDELDLEHALPRPAQEQPLHPAPHR
jgi:hypothetical protein